MNRFARAALCLSAVAVLGLSACATRTKPTEDSAAAPAAASDTKAPASGAAAEGEKGAKPNAAEVAKPEEKKD